MELQSLRLVQDKDLPRGRVRLPGERPPGRVTITLGAASFTGSPASPAPPGELHLGPDGWRALSVPFGDLQLWLRRPAPDRIELGPAIAVLYPGREDLDRREALARANLYYEPQAGTPGLFALAFDDEIDWVRRRVYGYAIDNRPGHKGRLVRGWFPLPAAVRLTWSIRHDVIARLRRLTGNRTFNWVRSIGKWRFHSLLSARPDLAPHLPETRLLQGSWTVGEMLLRYGQVYVKQAHGLKGRQAARVTQLDHGFAVGFLRDGQPVEHTCPSLDQVMAVLNPIIGDGRAVVQQAIGVTGPEGRPLHFRLVPVRLPQGGWRIAAATACVADEKDALFTNLANGAQDEDLEGSLVRHYGMGRAEAHQCGEAMKAICLTAAAELEKSFHPLGLLGFDLLVEQGSHRILLLEANAVPGWGYPPAIEQDLARSQIAFALSLTPFI